jgi:hypothetical protein
MTDFNPDSEIEPEDEVAEDAPEQSSNRTFILVALGLGGLFVIGLICIALFAFVVLPSRNQARQETSVAVITQNALVQTQAVETANPPTNTPLPTDIPLPTDTPVILFTDTPVIAPIGPSDTPPPTNTLGPSPTASRTPTRVGGGTQTIGGGGTVIAGTPGTGTPGIGGGIGATFTPTRITIGGGAATVTATFTIGPGTPRTATPTALPDTGFADNVGGPGLFIGAIVLVAVLFVARQLRMRNA